MSSQFLNEHDYYPLIARAVAGLGSGSTANSRKALYERAREAQGSSIDPALSDREIIREREALEQAIQKIEAEAAKSEAEQVESDRNVVFGFADFCEKTPTRKDCFYDASVLPFTREAIISAMEREIVRAPFQAYVDSLKIAPTFLINFLEGIGPEPIPFKGGPAKQAASIALKGGTPADREEFRRILATPEYKRDQANSFHLWSVADRENKKVEERIANALRARSERLAGLSQAEKAVLNEYEGKFKEFSKNGRD
jgi:hypothetical protein